MFVIGIQWLDLDTLRKLDDHNTLERLKSPMSNRNVWDGHKKLTFASIRFGNLTVSRHFELSFAGRRSTKKDEAIYNIWLIIWRLVGHRRLLSAITPSHHLNIGDRHCPSRYLFRWKAWLCRPSSLYLPIYLPTYLSIYLPIYLSIHLPLIFEARANLLLSNRHLTC